MFTDIVSTFAGGLAAASVLTSTVITGPAGPILAGGTFFGVSSGVTYSLDKAWDKFNSYFFPKWGWGDN